MIEERRKKNERKKKKEKEKRSHTACPHGRNEQSGPTNVSLPFGSTRLHVLRRDSKREIQFIDQNIDNKKKKSYQTPVFGLQPPF